jgi:hypothetical protein
MKIDPKNTTQKRLRILGDEEIETIYARPRFTREERAQYFDLSQTEKALLSEFRSIRSQIYFILQLGYFKAKHVFFTFDFHEVLEDAKYIMQQYFPRAKTDVLRSINKRTWLRQRRLILRLCNYRDCDAEQRQKLRTKARQAAMICSKSVYVFRELMQYLIEQRVVVPGYSSMQKIVGRALTYEQNRLISIARNHLKPSDIQNLNELLSDSQGLYEITLLKREPKDFSLKEIRREISRGEQIHHLYCLAKRLLPHLLISNESIKYYASLVTYYSVFRLGQLDERIVHIYLLCFVYHRYQKIHDNLINSLIYNVRKYIGEARSVAKERIYECRVEGNQNLQKAGQVLRLFTDTSIADDTPFYQVRRKAFGFLERQEIDFMADHIVTNARFDETAFQWEHIDKLPNKFKRNLRPVLLSVDFAASLANDPLIEAINFMKSAFQNGRSLGQHTAATFPIRFIPGTVKRYLYEQDTQGQLLPDRYEFLVYRLLRNGLEAGDIFCRDSVRFRSFEDDLLDNQRWQKKEELIINSIIRDGRRRKS